MSVHPARLVERNASQHHTHHTHRATQPQLCGPCGTDIIARSAGPRTLPRRRDVPLADTMRRYIVLVMGFYYAPVRAGDPSSEIVFGGQAMESAKAGLRATMSLFWA